MNSATKWYKILSIYFLIMLISNEDSCLKIVFNLMVSIFCKKMLIYFLVDINILPNFFVYILLCSKAYLPKGY